uniref:Neuropeptide W n=1 Tax=Chelonoidis abingdonii TaxID=106734 RepID=A0A8C0QQK1_CHEAB
MNLRHASGGAWKTLGLLGLMLLVDPVGAWYKHVASPRYHTVGRASGLLMGIRRSPYLWRRDLGDEPGESPGSPPTSVNRAPRLLHSRRQDLRAAGPRTQASEMPALPHGESGAEEQALDLKFLFGNIHSQSEPWV